MALSDAELEVLSFVLFVLATTARVVRAFVVARALGILKVAADLFGIFQRHAPAPGYGAAR